MNKLYVIVRNDLPYGLQAAQLVHAALQFADIHPEKTKAWLHGPNNVVLLQVPGLAELTTLLRKARCVQDIDAVCFTEPDLDGAMTSIAIGGAGAARLLSSLPCAMRPPREQAAA